MPNRRSFVNMAANKDFLCQEIFPTVETVWSSICFCKCRLSDSIKRQKFGLQAST